MIENDESGLLKYNQAITNFNPSNQFYLVDCNRSRTNNLMNSQNWTVEEEKEIVAQIFEDKFSLRIKRHHSFGDLRKTIGL
jgi:hypothetical protein